MRDFQQAMEAELTEIEKDHDKMRIAEEKAKVGENNSEVPTDIWTFFLNSNFW